MIPVLFSATETQFTSNGIGALSDVISCVVTEARNGAYEVEMQYPVDGAHFSDIALGNFIFCKPARYSSKQAFEIYQVTRPLNGIVTIYGCHISYRLDKTPCKPFTAYSCATALAGLKTNALESCPFTFSTTKTTAATYKQTVPNSIRQQLGGVEGSILDVFGGGDYEFDMYNVKLWADRGQNHGVTIRYGKNLTDINQEESIEDTITGIVPYFANQDQTVVGDVIESAAASSFPYHRTIAIDLSSEFPESVPTKAQLATAGQRYMSSHSIGVPKVNLTVSFINLADTEEYKDIAVLEDVSLCDTVNIKFDKLGVNATAKVIETQWDVLQDRYIEISLGSSRTTLATRIADNTKEIERSEGVMQDAIDRATNLITGEAGGYVVLHTNDSGKPYEILVMDTEDINTATHVWRWNKSGWGYSSNGYSGPYALAATIDGGIVADFITAGTITGIAYNNGNGTFKVTAGGALIASNVTITGGSLSINGGVFNVTSAGALTATSATITGSIQSGSTITGASINNGSGTFKVSSGGALTASSVDITSVDGTATLSIKTGSITISDTGSSYTSKVDKNGIYVLSSSSWFSRLSYDMVGCGNKSGNSFNYTSYIGHEGGYITGNFGVSGTKNRVIETEDYNTRLMYSYETPSPMFGDLGEGITDETGVCDVWLDDVFAETIDQDCMYQVFLQKYGEGDIWVESRSPYCFVVKGTPELRFGWEIKATQKGYDTIRLEKFEHPNLGKESVIDTTWNYLEELLYDIEEEAA